MLVEVCKILNVINPVRVTTCMLKMKLLKVLVLFTIILSVSSFKSSKIFFRDQEESDETDELGSSDQENQPDESPEINSRFNSFDVENVSERPKDDDVNTDSQPEQFAFPDDDVNTDTQPEQFAFPDDDNDVESPVDHTPPSECVECLDERTKIDTDKPNKGDHETCLNALAQLENVNFLLHNINEKGLEGPQGLPGPRGDKGSPGERGSPGIPRPGQKGSRGDSIIGPRGDVGPVGMPGPAGERGEKGIKGDMGISGPPGDFVVGPSGAKGERGDCVEKNFHGLPGPPGPQGFGLMRVATFLQLQKMTEFTTPGSIAYVDETGKFYGLTNTGWSSLMMNNFTKRPRKVLAARDRFGKSSKIISTRSPVKNVKPRLAVYKDLPKTVVSRLRLVALNEPWNGNMHGIDYINYQCQKEAMSAGINGIFRAFLSTRGVNLQSLVKNPEDVIVNLHNITLYSRWANVFQTYKKFLVGSATIIDSVKNGTSSVLYSFNGKNVILDDTWEVNMVWHGAQVKGKSSHRNCKNWTSNSTADVGISSDFLYRYMMDQQNQECNSEFIVLCVEIPPLVVQQFFSTLQSKYESLPNGRGGAHYVTFDDYQKFLQDYYPARNVL